MNIKDKKGSISIFVLVALLFMAGFLIISFGSNVNKSKTIKEQFNVISGIYSYTNGDEGAYDKAYTDLRAKNKQTMAASVENSNTIELTKTYEDKVSNYRIYGNSIQDGTPTPDTPVEVQSVGDIINLFPIDKLEVGKQLLCAGVGSEGYTGASVLTTSCLYIDLKPNTLYTLSINIDSYYIYRMLEMNSENLCTSDQQLYRLPEGKIRGVYTWKTNSSTDYMMIAIRKIDEAEILEDEISNIKLQLQEGAQVTEYLPYGKYGIRTRCRTNTGVNLFNKNNLRVAQGIQPNYWETNATLLAGYCSDIESNTKYTFSINLDKYYVYRIIEFDSNNTSTKTHYFHQSEADRHAEKTWTTNINTEYIVLSVKRIDGANTTKQDIDNIQLQIEKGDKATKYTSYQENERIIYLDEPLRKIGDVADYIDFKTGQVIRKIGVFDSYNGETVGTEYMSTTKDLSTGATIYYKLENEKYEDINLPQLETFEDYTKIEVLTETAPSKIEVEYTGYTLEGN